MLHLFFHFWLDHYTVVSFLVSIFWNRLFSDHIALPDYVGNHNVDAVIADAVG